MQPSSVEAMVEAARAVTRRAFEADEPRTVWIGIDGFGGSGKTTLATRLADALPGAMVVGVDDFAEPGLATWDHDRFVAELVEPLGGGRPARFQQRGWSAGPKPWIDVPAGIPVIVEGVSATDSGVAVPWDLTVWVHTDAAERWRRIEARDDADTLEIWRSRWLPSERAYAVEQLPQLRADLIVSGHGADSDDPRVSPGS